MIDAFVVVVDINKYNNFKGAILYVCGRKGHSSHMYNNNNKYNLNARRTALYF